MTATAGTPNTAPQTPASFAPARMPTKTSSGCRPIALLITRGATTHTMTTWRTVTRIATTSAELGDSKMAIESGRISASGGPMNGIIISAVLTTAVSRIRSRPATHMIAAVPSE